MGFYALLLDELTTSLITNSISYLESKGITTKMWSRSNVVLYPQYFSDRLSVITNNESEELFNILKDNDIITRKGVINRNPKSSGWLKIAKELFSESSLLLDYEEQLQELMLSAFGFHEFVSTDCDKILNWLYQ